MPRGIPGSGSATERPAAPDFMTSPGLGSIIAKALQDAAERYDSEPGELGAFAGVIIPALRGASLQLTRYHRNGGDD